MDDRGEIIELALAWAAAIVANDAAAIGAFMADDWVIVGPDGATTKVDFLALVASGDLTHDMMRTASEPRVEVHGATAVYTARVINSGHFRGQRFTADEWTSDVFVREGAGWKCVLSHVTPAAKGTADGD
ncbi:nuclear transport factor 2 family protein [Aminobacter aminovorans]|uniref:nuclear transport factor 2 family protein n=1 Tax=Aminobacter aminovorans TaxID=83263 RepID=UPI00285D6695|nr:nuclear transport factor 2 family protein [Aminobacter aminovorans]MDR7219963.1 ketosteroid isomerase-like protein [Aminobacter aminovorans]